MWLIEIFMPIYTYSSSRMDLMGSGLPIKLRMIGE
jgi:hypothetical protein